MRVCLCVCLHLVTPVVDSSFLCILFLGGGKKKNRPGVRSAESVKDGFLALLESGKTGCYLHVDEYDEATARGVGVQGL